MNFVAIPLHFHFAQALTIGTNYYSSKVVRKIQVINNWDGKNHVVNNWQCVPVFASCFGVVF